MFGVDGKQNTKEVFWSKFGVTAPGNRRPRRPVKMKSGRHTQEVKAKIPVKQPVQVMTLSPDSTKTQDLTLESLVEVPTRQHPATRHPHSKKASLKDLCEEDKKRVANLIKELAKMGDEKEAAVGLLQTERKEYEKQVMKLVEQQEQILLEREDIQSKLFQCQELLSRYKDQLIEKEDKLNTSISEMVKTRKEDRIPSQVSKPQTKETRKNRIRSVSPDPARRDNHTLHSPKYELVTENKENLMSHKNKELQRKYTEMETTKDKLYRPFTSMIDKEIAEKKDGLSTIVSESLTITPRWHDQRDDKYSDRIPTLKAFREPIMSSTQKSADINAFINEDSPRDEFHRLEPDSSPRSSRASFPGGSPRGQSGSPKFNYQNGKSNKVGFKEKLTVDNDELEKHSPQYVPASGQHVGSREFMNKYRKLDPGERKQQLLKQREVLLEEQKRLKQILQQQEEQLKRKQDLIDKRRSTQKSRIEYFEKNGEFPVAQDNESINGDDESVFNGRVDKLNLDKCLSDEEYKHLSDDEFKHLSDEGEICAVTKKKQTGADRIYTRPQIPPSLPHPLMHSIATSPHRPVPRDTGSRHSTPTRLDHRSERPQKRESNHSTPTKIDAATSYTNKFDAATSYSQQPQDAATSYSQRIEMAEDDIKYTPTKKMDAATSYSKSCVESPRLEEDVADLVKQNNLPLQANRQRSLKSPQPRTPGEKTLSIVEIVNSMEESPTPSRDIHQRRDPVSRERTPVRTKITQVRNSPKVKGTAIITSTSANSKEFMFGSAAKDQDRFDETLAEETAEESSLLDDIFFL